MLHPAENALLPYTVVISITILGVHLTLMEFSHALRDGILPSNSDRNNYCVSQASVYNLAPLNFRRRITRPVSYYALF